MKVRFPLALYVGLFLTSFTVMSFIFDQLFSGRGAFSVFQPHEVLAQGMIVLLGVVLICFSLEAH